MPSSEEKRNFLADFRDTTGSKVTLVNSESKLRGFLDYWRTPGKNLEEQTDYWVTRATKDTKWAEDQIIAFFKFQRTRLDSGEIGSADTVRKSRDAIKKICRVARIRLEWEYINMFLPKTEKGVGTRYRPYTLEEIRRVLAYPDRRIRPIVLLMSSSGMSIGSFERLKWGDIEPVTQNSEVTCAKVNLYRGKTKWNYPSFLTPECFASIKDYMNYRARSGEQITQDSPVLRDLFYPDSGAQAGSYAHLSRKLKVETVSDLVKKALRTAGFRPKKAPRGKGQPRKLGLRYPTQQNHGFRKFFETTAAKYMQPNGTFNAEVLTAHNLDNLAHTYAVPTPDEMMSLYLKAVPYLTITEEWRAKYEAERKVQEHDNGIEEELARQVRRTSLLETEMSKLMEEIKKERKLSESRSKKLTELVEGIWTQMEHESKRTTQDKGRLGDSDQRILDMDEQKMEWEIRELNAEAAEQKVEDEEQFRSSMKAKSKQ